MSATACSRIRCIVWLRQMLRRWQKNAATAAERTPADVPTGHVAVKVGSSCKRFVVQATYLNHPVFKRLLAQAEEEYGFANIGPLAIPCDEAIFEEIISYLSNTTNTAIWRALLILKGIENRASEAILSFGLNHGPFWVEVYN